MRKITIIQYVTKAKKDEKTFEPFGIMVKYLDENKNVINDVISITQIKEFPEKLKRKIYKAELTFLKKGKSQATIPVEYLEIKRRGDRGD